MDRERGRKERGGRERETERKRQRQRCTVTEREREREKELRRLYYARPVNVMERCVGLETSPVSVKG